MRSLLSISSILFAAVGTHVGASLTRRALTQSNLDQFSESLIVIQDGLPGFFLAMDIGGNEMLGQVDFQRCVKLTVPRFRGKY